MATPAPTPTYPDLDSPDLALAHLFFTQTDGALLEAVRARLNDPSRFMWNFSSEPVERRRNLFRHFADRHLERFGAAFFKGVWSLVHSAPAAAALSGALNAGALDEFFHAFLPAILQCPNCKQHYMAALQTDPPPLPEADFVAGPAAAAAAEAVFQWTVRLHNLINARQYKPQLDAEHARRTYGMPPPPPSETLPSLLD